MKKEIKVTIDPKIEEEKQRDRDLIIKLRRCTRPIQSEMDEIFYLYKKYINKEAQSYCASCNGGGVNSIQKYWMSVINISV